MITGPPSQQSLPSIPPSPTSTVSVHLSLVSSLSGPPSHTQLSAGTPPPTGPLPQLLWAAQLNPRIPPLSSSSPLTPPSLSLRGEQWPLRDDSCLDNMPKAQTESPCPEPSRQPPTTPETSSPSPIRPESRKELPKTALSLWPAQEPSRKPLNTTVVSLSPNEPRSEPSGGKGRMKPSPWLPSPSPPNPSPRQGPLGGEIRMEPSTWLIGSPLRASPRREPIVEEPGINLSPWFTGPSPRQRPYDGEPLSSSPMSAEAETEPSASLRRLSHRRGPCGVNPATSSPSPLSPSPRLGGETRVEPSQRLSSQAPREGSLGREPRIDPFPWLASPSPGPRPLGEEPSMEPSQRLTSQSPRHGPLGREPRMGPSPWLMSSPPPAPGLLVGSLQWIHPHGSRANTPDKGLLVVSPGLSLPHGPQTRPHHAHPPPKGRLVRSSEKSLAHLSLAHLTTEGPMKGTYNLENPEPRAQNRASYTAHGANPRPPRALWWRASSLELHIRQARNGASPIASTLRVSLRGPCWRVSNI